MRELILTRRSLLGCTILLITHRMSLVELADNVVVLDRGRIIEAGSPAELLASDGFLTSQFRNSRSSLDEPPRIVPVLGTESIPAGSV